MVYWMKTVRKGMKKPVLRTLSTMTIGFLTLSSVVIAADSSESYQSITPQEAHEYYIENPEAIILDVRTLEEYEDAHVKDAILLTLDELEEKYKEVLPDVDQMILIYCRSGRRSKIAAEYLAKEGYHQIFEFGGLADWEYETEKETDKEKETETETETDVDCQHEWLEDCVGKTCSKCGEYHRFSG